MLKEVSNPKFEYTKKVAYIEKNIERDIRYYDSGKAVKNGMKQMLEGTAEFWSSLIPIIVF